MAGTAVTVTLARRRQPRPCLRAFEFCRPGDVIVIDADGDLANAVIGGILSFYAATIGTVGVVLDGAIRDVAEIRERDFPVYARGVNHRGPYKDGPGEINVPVSVGGMLVNPGDIVVGDQDGLMAFSQDDAEWLIERARAHLATEAEHDSRHEGGPLGPRLHRCARGAVQQLSRHRTNRRRRRPH